MKLISDDKIHRQLVRSLIEMISETNGVSLADTLQLLLNSDLKSQNGECYRLIEEFRGQVEQFSINKLPIERLLEHRLSAALFDVFRLFPIKYHEEHIHLTGALTAEFIYPRLKPLLEGLRRETRQLGNHHVGNQQQQKYRKHAPQ